MIVYIARIVYLYAYCVQCGHCARLSTRVSIGHRVGVVLRALAVMSYAWSNRAGYRCVVLVLVGLPMYDGGMCSDALDLYGYDMRFRVSRCGNDVVLEHDGSRHVLPEPGISGLLSVVMPLILERHGSMVLGNMGGFLHVIIMPFARWLGLETASMSEYQRMSGSCYSPTLHGIVSFRNSSRLEGLDNYFSFRVPDSVIPDMGYFPLRFMSVGVARQYRNNHGSVHLTPWLALNGYMSGFDYEPDIVLIGPYETPDLIHEFRVLMDDGWLDDDSAGLVVELARKSVSSYPSVPRNVIMEDIIDGYPGASEYLDA